MLIPDSKRRYLELVSTTKFKEALPVLQDLELLRLEQSLSPGGEDMWGEEEEEEACVQMALLLLLNNLAEAKLLWRRSPSSFKSQEADLPALWAVGALLIQRHISQAYIALDGRQWRRPAVAALVPHLKAAIKERQMQLFSRAYRSLPLAAMAEALGTDQSAALRACRAKGWECDESAGTVKPRPPAATTTTAKEDRPHPVDAAAGLDHIKRLTEYINLMDKNSLSQKS